MAKLELGELREVISAMDASWEAGETEISPYLNQPQGAGLFGLSIGEEERQQELDRAFVQESESLAAAAAPPAAIDWRNHNGRNWVTPVKHQRTCGACIAFAICAVLESRTRLTRDDAGFEIDLSEADLFFCGCGRCCDSGWRFVPALAHCRNSGVGDEQAFPYTPRDQDCPRGQGRTIAPIVRVTNWSAEASMMGRKQALAANGPVIAGMRVYEDFYYYRSGTYRQAAGSYRGLHAVAVVGYDDSARHWIVKNSWGSGWGEGGFINIGYGECGIDSLFAFYDPFVEYVGAVT